MSASNTRTATSGSTHAVTHAARHRALGSESRQALLGVLERASHPLDATEAGRAVGLHRNTARTHLATLIKTGLVREVLERRTTPGRPRVLYELVPSRTELSLSRASDVSYRELARALANQLATEDQAQEKARAIGRRWASAIASAGETRRHLSAREAIDAVTHVLDEQGFEPKALHGSTPSILLERCPLADVADEARSVICSVHLGMLSATFEDLDSPLVVAGLDPFVSSDPPHCLLRLKKRPVRSRPDDSSTQSHDPRMRKRP